jgi:pimeloyl-ACP methyl ester carboxylesterase
MDNFQTFITQRLVEDGWDDTDFVVDSSFNFGCASMSACDSHWGSAPGAALLVATIYQRTSPGQQVILVGYSMGGLIARDMIAHASQYSAFLNQVRITALITLGTPNLGFPWAPADDVAGNAIGSLPAVLQPLGVCPFQIDQMGSDFRAGQAASPPTFNPHVSATTGSEYLRGLTSDWSAVTPVYWLAISGSYCNSPIRTSFSTQNYGCPSYNTDGATELCATRVLDIRPEPSSGDS